MKNILILIFSILFFTTPLLSQIVGGFSHDGEDRGFLLDLPTDYEVYENFPLVLNFHGFGSNNVQQRLYSSMTPVADTANFIVCYPQGLQDSWNVGWNFGSTADDVGFVNALIDSLAANYKINLDAVFSTGMSNGGFMSYKLACDLNHRIKAIASVTGSMHTPEVQSCTPDDPVPVMQIHGTADDVVPYNGNPTVNIGIEDLLNNWLQWNNCTSDSDTIDVENIDPNDGTTTQRIEFNDCESISRIVFYKIFGGGHTWPGAFINVGVTSQDFNASSEIWNFFKPFTPGLIVSTETEPKQKAELKIYPNPFADFIKIEAKNDELIGVRMFNSIGQIIYQKSLIRDSFFEIPSTQLKSGIYFINVETENGNQIFKMIRQ